MVALNWLSLVLLRRKNALVLLRRKVWTVPVRLITGLAAVSRRQPR
jgi:hypothetical protein